MSLVKAELRRLSRRRLTRWLLLLMVALLATVALVIAANHQKPGPAAVAEARAEAERQFEEQQRYLEMDIATCEQAQATGGVAAQGWPEDCQEIRQDYQPDSPEDMVEFFMPPAFNFRESFPSMIMVFAGLLGLVAFLGGASFVGAEWRSGGMMNLLLWRPQRRQVLGAKLAALLAGLAGLGVVLGAAWTGVFWLVATFRGVTDTMTSGAWQSIGLAGLRGLTLALVAGAVGFALASLGRHTAMAMGAAIAAFVVGIAGIGIVVGGMLQVSYPEAWLWTTYVYAWMNGRVELTDFSAPCQVGRFGECVQPTLEITWQGAGIGLAAVVALMVGAAMWQMRRRDVT
jgi:ABC-type transport system involved in multi-copper enzyme maturation permease subunit